MFLLLRGAELCAIDTTPSCQDIRGELKQQDRADLHRLLGDCEEASGNFREAANQYQIAAHTDPSEPNLFAFGSELLKYHGYSEAEQVLSYSAAQFPKSARLRVGLGVAQYSLGQYNDAVETLCQAVDLNPDDARALEFLGKMTDVAPELSGKVQARLERFARIYAKNPVANYYYAVSLLSSKATIQAEIFLRRALEQNPAYGEAHYELGIICSEKGHTQQAIKEYEEAVRYLPKLSAAHYKLAQLYTRAGQSGQAHREFQIVKDLQAH